MYRTVTAIALSALTIGLMATQAPAQSTTSDPIGINAIEDPTIQRQRGGLDEATTGSLGQFPNSQRNEDTIGGWTFDGNIFGEPRDN